MASYRPSLDGKTLMLLTSLFDIESLKYTRLLDILCQDKRSQKKHVIILPPTTNKKLSYCCESRSYWLQKYDRLKQLLRDTLSVLTPGLPYIHCDRSVSACE